MPTTEQNRARARIMRARIIDHIEKNGPSTNTALQIALGRSPSTIYYHVAGLAKEKKIHNEPVRNDVNCNPEAVWHLGENPNQSTDPDVIQRKVKIWPLHHVRDSLVTALFGAPQQVAA